MNAVKISMLLFIIIVFASCDCFRLVQGTVIDFHTKQPIEGVKVEVKKQTDIIIYSDSVGNFQYLSKTAGLPFCPSIVLTFEKTGYKKVTNKYKHWSQNTIVVLEKQVREKE